MIYYLEALDQSRASALGISGGMDGELVSFHSESTGVQYISATS